MDNEVHEIIDAAISKETASEALYTALQQQTEDLGACQLMKEMALDERSHSRWVQGLRDQVVRGPLQVEAVQDLKISRFLTSADRLDGAGLQDTIIFAIKHEEYALEFYAKMTAITRSETGKRLCQKLANEEAEHKLKLELIYDSLFFKDN